MNKKYIWLAKNCPNANHNYYEPEDRRQYIYCEKYKCKCKPTDICIKLYYHIRFKSKEELKIETMPDSKHWADEKYNLGVENAFKSFAERVEFYKKWSKFGAEPWRLRNENEELYDKWKSYDHKHNWTNGSSLVYDTHYFYQWLFDYCFGDVIE